MMDVHIPQLLIEIIVSKLAEDGVEALKNWLLAGREGKDVLMSTKTLASVCIDMNLRHTRLTEFVNYVRDLNHNRCNELLDLSIIV